MKLEEGMYVRFFNGDIGKIANYEYREEYVNGHVIYLEKDDKTGWCCEEKDFKASHNIIDLIEVGDYVNGSKVVNINYDLNYDEDIVESITIFDYSIEGNDILHNEDIKTIVTKEQFESMSYKVGEE